MITRFAKLTSRMAVLFAILFTIAACGGGGGDSGGFIPEDGGSTLNLQLFDPQGNATETVTSSKPGTLRVRVSGGRSGVVVSTTSDIGLVFPASGTALTNSDGVATFTIEAGVGKGAGTITSTATKDGSSYAGSKTFQVGDAGLRLGYFDGGGTFIENEIGIEPQSTLASGGQAQLTVVILDENDKRVTDIQGVRFNSGCAGAGQATISPANPVASVNGQASATYTATGCSGIDEISAALAGASAQAFASLSIAPAEANAVNFVSAEPTFIVLRGTGGVDRSETSDLVFKVIASNGSPLSGIKVDFSLSTEVGGLSVSPASLFSDAEGLVTATVSAGDVATTVRVIASVDNGSGQLVSTVSDLLTVTTGLPDQDSISLSVSDTFVVEDALNTDNVERTLTVSMGDKFNNPVADGTAAVFTTEYGRIVSTCTTTNGTCSVTWSSQAPRFPLLGTDFIRTIFNDSGYNCLSHNAAGGPCPNDLGYTRGGRSTILVHAQGEESFTDSNGNGVIDQGEQFENLPEAFLDKNEDGVYTPALPECLASPMGSARCIAGSEEIPIDFNGNGEYDLNDNPPLYNGLLCPPEGDGIWCSRDLVHVRADTVVTLAPSSDWYIILTRGGSEVGGTTEGTTSIAYISDRFNNPPPGGSTITVAAEGGCEILSEGSFTVNNFSSTGAVGVAVVTDGDGTAGGINITLEPTGNGAAITWPFGCASLAPPDPNAP